MKTESHALQTNPSASAVIAGLLQSEGDGEVGGRAGVGSDTIVSEVAMVK